MTKRREGISTNMINSGPEAYNVPRIVVSMIESPRHFNLFMDLPFVVFLTHLTPFERFLTIVLAWSVIFFTLAVLLEVG